MFLYLQVAGCHETLRQQEENPSCCKNNGKIIHFYAFKSLQDATCNLVPSTTGEGPNHWHFIYVASPGSIWKASSSDQLSAASGVQAYTPVPHPDQQLGKTEHHVKNAPDFADKARNLKLNKVSYDVTSQFTCTPPLDAITRVRKRLAQDFALSNRTRLSRLWKITDLFL